MKLLVIADDFTGANDTGVRFNKRGLTVDVILNLCVPYRGNADVVVVNTDSRAMMIENAQQQIQQAFSVGQSKYIYKKLDSTLRGNIGAEIAACLNTSKRNFAFVCSALPQSGRTVENGICYVKGVPLLETEFATDPKTPIESSNVSAIISAQTHIPVVVINLSLLRDSVRCAQHIQQAALQYPQCIFSFDAVESQDLRLINEQINRFSQPCIVAGSSGLAEYLQIGNETANPILFVIASMSEITQQQVAYIKNNPDITIINIDVERLLTVDAYPQQIIETALKALEHQQHLVLKTDSSLSARNHIGQLCETLSLNRRMLGEQITKRLSAITIQLLTKRQYRLAALFLTGGDMAIAVAKSLSLNCYRIVGEIENGVPFGYFPNSALEHIPVITKAGGFGTPNVLQNSIDFIKNIN